MRYSCRADRICVECSCTLRAGMSKLPLSDFALTHCRNTGLARRIRLIRASCMVGKAAKREGIQLHYRNRWGFDSECSGNLLPGVLLQYTGSVCVSLPFPHWMSSWWCHSSAKSAGCHPLVPPEPDTGGAEKFLGWTWLSQPLWGGQRENLAITGCQKHVFDILLDITTSV